MIRISRFFLLSLIVLIGLGFAVLAQVETPDYEAWETVASRAEEAVDNAEASDNAFESLRSELTDWRQVFLTARSVNAAPIAAVEAQLSALGPAPEEGQEAPETREQRETLNTRLNELRSPAQRAEVAFSRADALIAQIDRILRDRQTNQLLELGPTPVNPVGWPPAIETSVEFFYRTALDIQANWRNDASRIVFRQNLPATLLLLSLAAILTLRGRHWVELLVTSVQDRNRTAERWLAGLVMSVGQIILPVLGLLLLTVAGELTGILGARGMVLMQSLPAAGFAFFAARWLGGRMFPRSETFDLPLELTSNERIEGRLHSLFLGLVLLILIPLREVRDFADWSPEVYNVLSFPVLVVAGLSLFRMGRLLVVHAKTQISAIDEPEFRYRLLSLLARAMMILAFAGPVLAGIGYFNAGEALVFPTIYTMMLLSLIVVLQRLVNEVYILFTRNRDGVGEALTPVLAGFALAVGALPILALIWGARVTDLTELWGRFLTGFQIGDTRISPTDFLTFAIVFALGYLLTRLVQSALRTSVLPKTKLDAGGQNAVTSGLGYVGIFIAGIVAITSAGLDLSSLAIVAGALSVGIGFGLQNIVSNFVSGIILLIERPIAIGDWIEVGGEMGFVRDISVRSTRIETFDRTDVIVPNADLVSGKVTNWTRGNMVGRLIVPIGVAYGTDTRRVEAILQEVAEAHPMVVLNPPPFILFKGFGADSLDFEIRAILRDVTAILVVQTEMNHQIAERFHAEGIEIPFAQRDIWVRNPEALRGEPARPQTPVADVTPSERRAAAAQLDVDDMPGSDTDGDSGGDGGGDR